LPVTVYPISSFVSRRASRVSGVASGATWRMKPSGIHALRLVLYWQPEDIRIIMKKAPEFLGYLLPNAKAARFFMQAPV